MSEETSVASNVNAETPIETASRLSHIAANKALEGSPYAAVTIVFAPGGSYNFRFSQSNATFLIGVLSRVILNLHESTRKKEDP